MLLKNKVLHSKRSAPVIYKRSLQEISFGDDPPLAEYTPNKSNDRAYAIF